MQPTTNTTARLWAFAISLIAFLSPAVSGAQEDFAEATREAATKSRLMANYGLFSAIGEIGGTYTYAPVPEFQMEFGAGIGLSGLQLSFMPKLSMIAAGITRGIAGEYRNQCVIDCDGDTKGSSRPTTDIPLLPQGRIAFGRWF
jgi:hypothetical protein